MLLWLVSLASYVACLVCCFGLLSSPYGRNNKPNRTLCRVVTEAGSLLCLMAVGLLSTSEILHTHTVDGIRVVLEAMEIKIR
jgi:hypothetical protein